MTVETGKFSIPTRYNGVIFRSKLEANWAEFFHRHKIVYAYEPEGLDLDGVWYLPDFWLPQSRTIVEVKGIMDRNDETKLKALNRNLPEDIFIVVAESPVGKNFWGIMRPGDNPYLEQVKNDCLVLLSQCDVCEQWWFYFDYGSWKCRCCGAYDGNGHIRQSHYGQDGWNGTDCTVCEQANV